jgi:hypothetical protein
MDQIEFQRQSAKALQQLYRTGGAPGPQPPEEEAR